MEKETKNKTKIKQIKKAAAGNARLIIYSGFNNTIIRIAHVNWEKIGQISARTATGYKGAKKTTPYAARKAAEKVLEELKELNISRVKVTVKGVGKGQSEVLRKICSDPDNLWVENIENKIALPFNGCRPRKAPRK